MLTDRQRRAVRKRRLLKVKRHQLQRGTSDYVCVACGNDFLSPAQHIKREAAGGLVSTMHAGVCDVCHEWKTVTHIRHFNYLQKREEGQ